MIFQVAKSYSIISLQETKTIFFLVNTTDIYIAFIIYNRLIITQIFNLFRI